MYLMRPRSGYKKLFKIYNIIYDLALSKITIILTNYDIMRQYYKRWMGHVIIATCV